MPGPSLRWTVHTHDDTRESANRVAETPGRELGNSGGDSPPSWQTSEGADCTASCCGPRTGSQGTLSPVSRLVYEVSLPAVV